MQRVLVFSRSNKYRMSSHTLLEVECPSCKAKQDIMVWQSVEVTGDPELKEQLFTGKINYFSCSACDFEGFITAPLVYHDRDQKICACYVPVESFGDEEYLKRSFTPDGRIRNGDFSDTAAGTELQYLQDAQIVFSMTELIRYVLFRDRLSQVFSAPPEEE